MSTQPGSGQALESAPGDRHDRLPVMRELALAGTSSLVIALLASAVSIAGILCGTSLYQTEEMLLLKAPTDFFTLVIAAPILLVSIWLAWRGWLLGLLCWPASLLYMLYIYLANAIGVPLSVAFLAYVAIAATSAYTLIGLVASIDAKAVQRRLAGAVPARLAGSILAGMSVLFSLMNLAYVVTALTDSAPGHPLEMPVWITDFVVLAPAWIIVGMLLLRRKALGFVAGASLLLVGCMLFLGAIFSLVYTALYTASPLDLGSVVTMLVASLICVVPFALFVRGIVRSDRNPLPERYEGQGNLGS